MMPTGTTGRMEARLTDAGALLSELGFRHPWRTYQRLMLSRVETAISESDQRTFHLVAPPGSGKTIVGIELVRRFAAPAVVFVPTTTIQKQWVGELTMFADPEVARRATSMDPERLSAINVLTYQVISTQERAGSDLRTAAIDRWVDDLVEHGQTEDRGAARERIQRMRDNHRGNFRREVSRRVRAERRRLLRGGAPVDRFLHANALATLDRLTEHGVRTVVLDECHHLLDHWAMVVRALLDRIGDGARVVGLTATLPDPDDRMSYDNYTSLLGDVDFEVPLPAVIKEGDLAPFRDLAWFVRPTERERDVLDDARGAFAAAIGRVLDDARLTDWALDSLLGGGGPDERADRLAAELRERPAAAIARVRWLASVDAWPSGLPLPADAEGELSFDDQLELVERFGLDVLAVSGEEDDHETLAELRQALRGFGVTLTERGLRHGRSAGDMILAFSAAKDDAVRDLLARESEDLGDRLRAVIVTDFAEMSSAVARVGDGLDHDAGSAHRVFDALVADPDTNALDPMLITGRTVLVDRDHGDELVADLNAQLSVDGLDARCSYRDTDDPLALEIVGEGPDWSSRTYVQLLTEVFESGVTRCLVGTRGIFGEGWDALSLNTLVDLTSVTTSTGVQQLRGRSVRLHPGWPRKVAHNWDVVCVAPDHPRGDRDLERFVRRHGRIWGIVPPPGARRRLERAAAAATLITDAVAVGDAPGIAERHTGQVARGVIHVSQELATDLAFRPLKRVPFERHTHRSLAAIGDRDRSYDLWGIGEPYDNFETRAARIDPGDLRIRTVHTVSETLRALLARTALVFGGIAVLAAWFGVNTLLEGAGLVASGVVAAGVAAGGLALNWRTLRDLGRMLFVEQPPDAILRDIGHAVLDGLQGADLVSPHLHPEYVRVRAHPDQSLEVLLDYASPEDAAAFVAAYEQAVGPIRDPRYLIRRTDGRLPSVPLRAVWLPLRELVRGRIGRPSYHPVPDALGVNRSSADAYASAWSRYVGGGDLVYTRSDEGRRVLLEARAQPRRSARSFAFERWR